LQGKYRNEGENRASLRHCALTHNANDKRQRSMVRVNADELRQKHLVKNIKKRARGAFLHKNLGERI
jgi:hypothetical protein